MGKRFLVMTEYKAVDSMSPAMNRMNKGFSRLAMNVTDSSTLMGKAYSGANRMINNAMKAGVIALGAAVAIATAQNAAFTDGMAKVATIADTSTVSLEQQSKMLLGVSSRTGQSVIDLAEAQYQAISAGVESAKSAAFVETATKAAIGGFTDSATAVDGLTTVLNAYSLSADHAARISDQMITAQNFGKTTFGDMAGYLGQVIPIASALNVQTEELFASIATLTKQGIPTSAAMTGIKAALSNILKPAGEAAKVAEQLGLDFSSSALKSKGFTAFLADVMEKTGGNEQTLSKLFGSVEALNSVLALTKNGGADFTAALDAMADSAGATDSAFNTVTNTLSYKFNTLKNKAQNALITLGAAIEPILLKIVDKANAIDFDAIAGKITENIPKITEVVDKISSAIGFLIQHGPIIGSVLLSLVAGIKGVSLALGVLTVAQKLFNITLQASTIGIVITAVALLATGLTLLITNWDAVVQFLQSYGLPILAAVATALTGLTVVMALMNAVNPFLLIITGITILAGLIIALVQNWDTVTAAVGKFFSYIADVAVGIWTGFLALLERFTGFLTGSIIPAVANIGQAFMKFLLTPINLVMDGIISLLNVAGKIPGIGDKFKGAADGMQAMKDKLNTTLTGSAGTFDYKNIFAGAETSTPSAQAGMNGRVDVNFNNVPEQVKVKSVNQATGLNLKINPALN